MTSDAELGRSTARAAGWALLATTGVRLVSLVSLAVLARLLAPRDFGLLGVALVYITYVETIADLGTGSALIWSPSKPREAADVTFLTSLASGAFWFAATWLAAPFIAGFFSSPDGAPIIRALAFSFPIKYLGNAHDYLAQKELQFRKRMTAELAMAVVKAGVSIGCAFAGMGAWSLVWGQLSGLAVWTALLWIVVPFRPSFRIDREVARPMFRFGRGMIAVNVVAAVVHHADAVVVGRYAGAAALGIYQVAYKVPEMSIAVLMWVVSKVAFPAFAKLHAAGGEMASAYRAAMRYVTALTIPVAAGLWLVAEPLVLALFGSRWIAAVPVVRIIALYMAIRSFGTAAGDVLKATGRSRVLALLGIARAAVLIPALIAASRFGIVGVATALAAITALSTLAHMVVAGRMLHLGPLPIVAAIRSSLIAGAVMVGLLLIVRSAVGSLGAPL
ncbi:MAG TPA: lipopolysaccharide biosynthesis protein, partial [Thermoanaerobaculia bacterium]